MQNTFLQFLLVIALINLNFQMYQNLLFGANVIIICGRQFLLLKNYYGISNLAYVMEIVMQLGIWVQFAMDATVAQITAILLIQINLKPVVQLMIGISISIHSLVNPELIPYYIVIPYMGILLMVKLLIKQPETTINNKNKNEETTRQLQQTHVISRRLSVELQEEIKQPSRFSRNSSNIIVVKDQELEEQEIVNSNPVVQEMNENNEEQDILSQMAWIHNQNIAVYNQKSEIIYQTFFLGNLLKKGSKMYNQNFEQIFLDSVIEIGSREVNEMFGNSEDDEMRSDSFMLNGTAHSRYKINGGNKIREMVGFLFESYQKWKFFTFTLYKLRNTELDFNGVYIKILVNEVKNKMYVLFTFEVVFMPQQKRMLDEPGQFQNVFSTFLLESNSYINTIHMFLLLCLHEVEKGNVRIPKDYLKQMRMSTLKFMTFIATMKDLTLKISDQLIFRNSHFKITDIIDELSMIYEDCLKIKEITVIPIVDSDATLNNDQERTKQVIKVLFDLALKYTVAATIRLDVRQYSASCIVLSIRDIPVKDEVLRLQYLMVLKTTSQLMRSNCKDFDISPNLELQIASILSFQLSGASRKPLDCSFDSKGNATFQLYIESTNNKQILQNYTNSNQKKRPFETSLSMLLAQAQDSSQYKGDDSRFLSMTQFSKQYSIKQGEAILDMQSAHFSQISRVRQESSPLNKAQSNSGTQKPPQGQDSLLNPFMGMKAMKSDSVANDSSNKPPSSALDFGESTTPNIDPPELSCKFLGSVIKFKLTNQCCSKVLIADNDYFTVSILQILLDKYDVKADKSFTGNQAIQMIQKKRENPCRCKNNSYLLFFLDTHLPEISGVELTKEIRSQFRSGIIDKAFLIAMAGFSDMDLKLECFKSGIDYFLSKPFDLFELTAILQYLQF